MNCETMQNAISVASNICSILTFIGVLIAVISFFKNLPIRRHFSVYLTVDKNNRLSNNVRIDFFNKTSRSFYIVSAKVFDGNQWHSLLQQVGNQKYIELTCLKIDPYEPRIIPCCSLSPIKSDGAKLKLFVQTTSKNFIFKLKPDGENDAKKSFAYKRLKRFPK